MLMAEFLQGMTINGVKITPGMVDALNRRSRRLQVAQQRLERLVSSPHYSGAKAGLLRESVVEAQASLDSFKV